MGRVLVIEAKYIFCFNIAVFLLFWAALIYEISFKSSRVIVIRILRMITWFLLSVTAVVLLVCPFLMAGLDYQPPEELTIIVNLGLLMLLVVFKEAVREWKNPRRRKIKLPAKDFTGGYFDGLPKLMERRKKPIYFDFK